MVMKQRFDRWQYGAVVVAATRLVELIVLMERLLQSGFERWWSSQDEYQAMVQTDNCLRVSKKILLAQAMVRRQDYSSGGRSHSRVAGSVQTQYWLV